MSLEAIVEESLRSFVVLVIESLVSSASSTVESLKSLEVASSAVLRSSETLTVESFTSPLTLVTVLSADFEVSTAPSFIEATESLASLLILLAASLISLNISPKLNSADAVVNIAAVMALIITIFFIGEVLYVCLWEILSIIL